MRTITVYYCVVNVQYTQGRGGPWLGELFVVDSGWDFGMKGRIIPTLMATLLLIASPFGTLVGYEMPSDFVKKQVCCCNVA